MSVASRALARFRINTNGLHWSILVLYFFTSFLESFPMTAFGDWLQNDLQMPVADQSNFYACIFIPWTLKPLYGWISERLPIAGRRRKPYLIACLALSAVSWLIISHFVHTTSGAYGLVLMRTTTNAFAELLLGLSLLDCAQRNMANAGHLQAAAATVRNLATLVALLVGLPMYPCHGSQPHINSRSILMFNGLVGICVAFLGFYVPDPRVGTKADATPLMLNKADRPQEERSVIEDDSDAIAYSSDLTINGGHPLSGRVNGRFPTVELILPSLMLFFVWSACQDLMNHARWLIFLYVVLAINAVVLGLVLLKLRQRTVTMRGVLASVTGIWPAVVLFVMNATPTAADALYSFQYAVWPEHECYIQTLEIVSSCVALLASTAFYTTLSRMQGSRLVTIFLVCSGLSSLVSLMWSPWIGGQIAGTEGHSLLYAIGTTIVTEAVAELALVAGLVLATQACPVDDGTSGTTYALYIAFMDVGDSAAGWITAPITKALGIAYDNFARLNTLLYIDVGASVGATLLFGPLLYLGSYAVGHEAPAPVELSRPAQAQGDDLNAPLLEPESASC